MRTLRSSFWIVGLLLTGAAHGIYVQIEQMLPPTCTYSNGMAHAYVEGGVPPYSYLWSNGEVTEHATALPPGTVSVEVTDSEGATSMAYVYLSAMPITHQWTAWIDHCCTD